MDPVANLRDLRQRILRAREEEGVEPPTDDEIREGLRALRADREVVGTATAKRKRPALAPDLDLNSLFGGPKDAKTEATE